MQTPHNENETQAPAEESNIHDVSAVAFSAGVTGIAWSMELEGNAQLIVETGSITLVAATVALSAVTIARNALRNRRSQL